MKFKNNNHQALFNNEAKRMNRHDNVKMAVLYLLTADFKLWNEAKRHIRRGNIDLDTADAHGQSKAKSDMCGDVSTALTSAKNTATNPRRSKKRYSTKQS